MLIALSAFYASPFVPAILVLLAVIFIVATMRIQIRRYRTEGADKKTKRQNLFPLLGYMALFIYAVATLIYRLPEMNIVLLHNQQLNFSLTWQLTIAFLALGFLLLAFWAWAFIKVRVFLRTYVLFLAIGIFVSALGSLILTFLVFQIVETNNLSLMEQGAKTEQIIVNDRTNTALTLARTIANDASFITAFKANRFKDTDAIVTDFFKNSGADIIRIYTPAAEIYASPSDSREKGKVMNEDYLVTFALTQKQQSKSLDTEPGVLTPTMLTRGIYPIISNGQLLGAVEVGFKFDNAFVDFSNTVTGLDVTIYANDKRSATTITTLDQVSRWVGSKETDTEVLDNVLTKGGTLAKVVDRLGTPYYSAFVPLRDINGKIIGMISVGTPTFSLFEETRQQLITTFLALTVVSLLMAMVGYGAIRNFRKSDNA